MKTQIMKPTDVDIKYIDVKCGGRLYPEDIAIGNFDFETFEELFNKYPELEKDGELYLRINVDTGIVENWPKGIVGNFENAKVVDEGTYDIYDSEEHLIHHYEGYVPSILEIDEIGYGDYFEFCIDEVSHIMNWHCDSHLLQELLIEDE